MDDPQPLVVCEVDFSDLGFPRSFNNHERELWRETHRENNMDSLKTDVFARGENAATSADRALAALERRAGRYRAKPVKNWDFEKLEKLITEYRSLGGFGTPIYQDFIEHCDEELVALYEGEGEEWDEAAMAVIHEARNRLVALHEESLRVELDSRLKIADEVEQQWAETLEIVDKVNLITCYRIARHHHIKVGKVATWIESAGDSDYTSAEQIVLVGKVSASIERRRRQTKEMNDSSESELTQQDSALASSAE